MLRSNSLRISQIQGMQYSLNYLIASSMGGAKLGQNGAEPAQMTVTMNIDLKEYPKVKAKPLQNENEEQALSKQVVTPVKFSTTRDKFLQFSKDMRGALALLEATQQ